MAKKGPPTQAELDALENACNIFYLRVLEGVESQLEPAKQWWPIVILCSVAIDAMATAQSVSGVSARSTFRKFMETCPAFRDYAPFAARFYASVRSGIVHSLLPNHKPPKQQKSTKAKAKPKKKQERFKPAAISDSASPPQVQKIAGFPRRDLLVIGAPHLLACTKQMLADFRKRPITREHRRFMKRFVQTVYDETPAGLVRKI